MAAQQDIDFGVAEGSYADRKSRIGLALLRCEADLHLARFVCWVFESTHGGLSGNEFVKSYQELCSKPWGLCCSYGKARATVARALQYRLIGRTENRYVSFGQRANGYWIDWPGVDAVLKLDRRPGAGGRHPPVTSQQGPVTSQQGPVTSQQAYKDTVAFPDGFSGVVPLPAPAPEGPLPLASTRGPEPKPEPVPQDLLDLVPELADAVTRDVDALPVSALNRGVWSVLQEKHLASPVAIVDWFRRQLSLPDPVCGGTEAELLLVLAAARHASGMRAEEIQKNRCAVFVGIVRRRSWRRVLRFVGQARADLDAYEQRAALRKGTTHACDEISPARAGHACAAAAATDR